MSNTKTEAQRLADELAMHDDPRLYCEADELMARAADELRRLDAVEAENKRLKDRLDFHLERSAQREQRLWVWAHEELSEPLKTRYFNIVANGTADVMEQPVYAQQFNIMRHRAEAAEAEREQLREALQKILNWNSHTTNYAVHLGSNGVRDFYREIARQALATTEPVMANGLTEAETDASASVVGFATTAPAVNQQLTTEPFDEREEFEREMAKPPFEFCMDRWPDDGAYAWPGNYAAYHTQCAWVAWQARAAMAQVSDINVVESFTNDTKDAERYRWLRDDTDSDWAICEWSHDPGDEGYYRDARAPHIVDAAIDAAMAQGVKG